MKGYPLNGGYLVLFLFRFFKVCKNYILTFAAKRIKNAYKSFSMKTFGLYVFVLLYTLFVLIVLLALSFHIAVLIRHPSAYFYLYYALIEFMKYICTNLFS